ncbi:MAG TPA: ABC transporter permease [Thermoplasmata archaeon]|nr:ABC transporter permease [Thermoplasmata archaeon]
MSTVESPIRSAPVQVGPALSRAFGRLLALSRAVWKVVRSDYLALTGFIIISFFIVAALIAWLAPGLVPFSQQGQGLEYDAALKWTAPSWPHIMGTDELGRDLFSRIWFGSSIALEMGALTVAIAFPVGVILGVVAGYIGKLTEEVIMRVTDMFLAFPTILLAFVIAATLSEHGTFGLIIAMAVSFWPWYTRLVHAQVLQVRSQPFIEAAVVLGLPRRRVIFRHVLPNSLTSATIQATMDFGSAILIGSSLSWIGLGAAPPTPDWGVMFYTAYLQGSIITYWWYTTFVGLAIFLVVLAFNLLGDGFREALDPKLRRRRLF